MKKTEFRKSRDTVPLIENKKEEIYYSTVLLQRCCCNTDDRWDCQAEPCEAYMAFLPILAK
jgi:hypothetical protein